MPTGDTLLQAGDVVTAFGTTRGQNRLIDRLNATADEPTAEIQLDDEVEGTEAEGEGLGQVRAVDGDGALSWPSAG